MTQSALKRLSRDSRLLPWKSEKLFILSSKIPESSKKVNNKNNRNSSKNLRKKRLKRRQKRRKKRKRNEL